MKGNQCRKQELIIITRTTAVEQEERRDEQVKRLISSVTLA